MKTSLRAWTVVLIQSCTLTAFLLFTQCSQAQVNNDAKLSPLLFNEIKKAPRIAGPLELFVTIKGSAPPELNALSVKAQKLYEYGDLTIFKVFATIRQLDSVILPVPQVIFIEKGDRIPKEELIIGNLDLSVNKINLAHKNFSSINGGGIVVSVKENKPDTADIDLKGRFLATNLASTIVNSHATIMATMIGGAGNTWHLSKGAAWGSTISSSSYAVLLPDATASYQQYDISVQNHSYGVGVESYYGTDAAAYDATAIGNPSLLHVFSSGNSGTSSAPTGTYAGLNGFANLTGSFKMAKNIVTVGATDSFSNVAALSSKGPAHDGRVKPELVAFGEDGSSGAAALVSGTALLLQQSYKQTNGTLPANSLIKAILVNSADDVGNAEVDYKSGYGALNANNAMKTLRSNNFFIGNVTNSTTQTFSIAVPPGIKKMKVTLVWTDPPAAPNAAKALMNDLDLELTEISSGQIWKPWVLNSYPDVDSLNQLAKRKKDSLNNVEQVTINDPVAGNYQLKVTGYNVTTTSQSFHIAWQLDSIDKFEWQFPTANDFIFPSSINNIRWQNSFGVTNGILEYATNGTNWQQIQNLVDLSTGHFYWNVPAIISTAQLRMTIGSDIFLSDTFTIANRTTTGAGFNCPDSFLIYWNKLPTVTNYRIYKLGNKYLEPLIVTADSFMVLVKSGNPSLHYAAAPIIGNKEGIRSYTFNYTTQGVECYLRSFLAFLVGNSAQLTLSLGTIYNVNKIVLEKFNGTIYSPIQTINNPGSLQYNFTDVQLTKGLNVYRVRIELSGGRVIYTSVEAVYYFSGSEFIVYPNPAGQYQAVTILSDNQFFDPVTLQVINMQGQKVYEMQMNDVSNQIPAGKLSKGIYVLRIIRKGQKDVVLKLFIQ